MDLTKPDLQELLAIINDEIEHPAATPFNFAVAACTIIQTDAALRQAAAAERQATALESIEHMLAGLANTINGVEMVTDEPDPYADAQDRILSNYGKVLEGGAFRAAMGTDL